MTENRYRDPIVGGPEVLVEDHPTLTAMEAALSGKSLSEKEALLESLTSIEDLDAKIDLIEKSLGISLGGVNGEIVSQFIHLLAKKLNSIED